MTKTNGLHYGGNLECVKTVIKNIRMTLVSNIIESRSNEMTFNVVYVNISTRLVLFYLYTILISWKKKISNLLFEMEGNNTWSKWWTIFLNLCEIIVSCVAFDLWANELDTYYFTYFHILSFFAFIVFLQHTYWFW